MKTANFFIKLVATFFYTGYFPLIPGTFASFLGLILFFILSINTTLYILFTLCILALGFLVSGRAEQILAQKDSRYIVIDEVAGMLFSFISLLFFRYDLLIILIGFLLFRLLDTLKPYPASKIQGMHGSIGIMGDDIVAAIYTNIILQVVLRGAPYILS